MKKDEDGSKGQEAVDLEWRQVERILDGFLLSEQLLRSAHGMVLLFRCPKSSNASMLAFDDAMGAWWWTNEGDYS